MIEAGTEGRLLIVDDEAVTLKNLTHVFRKEGFEVVARSGGTAALNELRRRAFDVILTDLRMEKVDGMAILRTVREQWPESEVIVITGHATLSSAVDAMREGAFHYVAKPFRLDEVRQVVRAALDVVRLKRENRQLRERIESYEGRVTFITRDLQLQHLLDTARQVAPTDCNVLITGESGTGKELLARFVHDQSRRAAGPFVAINCGALQAELLASELFGHEKGAFTSADRAKPGLVEMAEGGTLLLDEIAEMTPDMQVKLLRVIQEREVLRVGGTATRPVDVRFIAATHRDLGEAVASGRFRHDLYYRLNVVGLHLPPLVERRDDIPLLAYHFLKRSAAAMGKEVQEIEPEAMRVLTGYDYPGNIRELANLIERGVALTPEKRLRMADLPEGIRTLAVQVVRPSSDGLPSLEMQEASYIREVLEHTGGNRTRAARILGIDRVSLWRKIKRYGLEG